jgi:hypothetical protein
MKKLYYILLLFSIVTFSSCEKDSENVSKTTYYANFEVKGDKLVVIEKDQTYVDAGAVALEGTKELPVTTKSNLDISKAGVYTILYSARNSDNYDAFEQRTVIVLPVGVSSMTDDLSGSYQRDAGKKGISVWTKISNGLYRCTDVGGASLNGDYVYVFNTAKNVIVVPSQPLGGSGSTVTCTNETGGEEITFTSGAVGTISYSWSVKNGGYGAAVRNFIKVN